MSVDFRRDTDSVAYVTYSGGAQFKTRPRPNRYSYLLQENADLLSQLRGYSIFLQPLPS